MSETEQSERATGAEVVEHLYEAPSGDSGGGASNEEKTDDAAGTAGKGDADPAGAAPPLGAPPQPAEAQTFGFIPHITIGAFADDPGVRDALKSAASDRHMSRTVFDLHDGGLDEALAHFEDAPTPDLIITETRLDGEALFSALNRLASHCPAGTRLVLVGHSNDVALYRKLLKFGVGDYLVAPLSPLGVIDAVSQLFEEGDADRLGKVTAFFATRGGAGSSTVAINTAAAMARNCHSSVLLADLDLAFGTAAFDLDMDPTQGSHDALEEGERLDETLLDRLVTVRDERIGLLAAPALLEVGAEPDPEALLNVIDKARTLTPHLLLDLPHCWAGWVRKALRVADEIVLTATPDLASLRNARNLVVAARSARQNDPAPRLILNQVNTPKRREAKADDFKRVLDIEPVAQIPFDPSAFSEAATKGELVAETRANAAAAQAFDELALLLTGRQTLETVKRPKGLARLLKWSA